jgi:hypothetical protein
MKLPHYLLSLIVLPFISIFAASDDAPVVIRDVKFENAKDDWIVAEIKLDAIKNPKEDARDKNYVDNIKVTLTVAFEVQATGVPKNTYDFYKSELEVVSIKAAEPKYVYFLLPGVIVERDKLKKDPFAWMVELEVDGEKLEPTDDHISKSLQKLGVQNFLSKANAGISQTENLLMPVYLAPGGIFKYKDLPIFIRKEADK